MSHNRSNSDLWPHSTIDYEIIERLETTGFFSDMYLARHNVLNNIFALKVNKWGQEHLENLIDEFNILQKVHHPNIVEVAHSSKFPDGRYFLAMEYLEGQSVREQLESMKLLSMKERLEPTKQLAKDMLDALRYLHEPDLKKGELKGSVLLHRDIKPENIMYVENRGYVLIDFNISKRVMPEPSQTFTGTQPYIAPDLIDYPNINWDESADTFALGCTLFELLTGRHPYDFKPAPNQTPLDINSLPGAEDIPQVFKDFLNKAVQTQADKRFKTAQAMEQSFEGCFKKKFVLSQIDDLSPDSHFKPSPWIRFLRQYGPIARNSNMYDESIQRELKRTKLDPLSFKVEYLRELNDNFTSANPKCVILTGTAGDGKTFTSRRIWELLGGTPEDWEKGNTTPILAVTDSLQLVFVKDLSELKDEVARDIVIRMAAAMLGESTHEVFLIAANDGQLMERWGQAKDHPTVAKVHPILEEMLVSDKPESKQLKLILRNLSRIMRDRDTYQEMFDVLLQHEGWQHCHSCTYQSQCPIWENRTRLEGKEDGRLLQKRLIDLLELSQLNDRHLTTRQLLLLFSNALLGHPDANEHLLRCNDIPDILHKQKQHLSSIYRNLFGENLTPRKRENYDIFKALSHFGIGYETNNRIDDTLIFGNDNPEYISDYAQWVKRDRYYGEHSSFRAYQTSYIEGEVDEREDFLELLRDQRQRLFFILPEDQVTNVRLWELTVYHSAGTYLALYHDLKAKTMSEHSSPLKTLLRGFNRITTGLPTLTQDVLYLTTSGCYTQAKVSSVWEGSIPITSNQGLAIRLMLASNRMPSMIIRFSAKPTQILEYVPLPLYRFEFLYRVAEGLLPSSFSNEYYKDILAIKTRLLKRWDEKESLVDNSEDDDLFSDLYSSPEHHLQLLQLDDDGSIHPVKVVINLPTGSNW